MHLLTRAFFNPRSLVSINTWLTNFLVNDRRSTQSINFACALNKNAITENFIVLEFLLWSIEIGAKIARVEQCKKLMGSLNGFDPKADDYGHSLEIQRTLVRFVCKSAYQILASHFQLAFLRLSSWILGEKKSQFPKIATQSTAASPSSASRPIYYTHWQF